VAKPPIAAAIPSTSPAGKTPCSNVRSVCVNDKRDKESKMPVCPASAKSRTQEPTVTASVMIAAVAELSAIDAAASAIAATRTP
jgi:hypothetical protein